MSKPYPEYVSLKKCKCPACGNMMGGELRRLEDVVRAQCGKPGCDYGVDLYWLGPATISAN